VTALQRQHIKRNFSNSRNRSHAQCKSFWE